MKVEATTTAALGTDADTIVVGAFEGESIAHDFGAGVLQSLLDRGEAKAKRGHLAVAHDEHRRVIVVGLGERERFDAERARVGAAFALRRAQELGTRTLCWEVPHHVGDDSIGGFVEGTLLRAYRFDRFKPDAQPQQPERLLISAHHDVSEIVRVAEIATAAQNRARDLANTPANELTPARLAEYAERLPGVTVKVLDENGIRAAGMGAFAAVARGSAQEACLIRLEYRGIGYGQPKLGLIGKAVTFDSGGLSIKPAAKMHHMKFDMSGGAAVIEAIGALAQLEAPVDVLGVVGATENLPSGSAVRPGDIVRALDGTTIEVNNTDAEGRLVLADCMSYAWNEGCERLVDLATLTGGIVVALGSLYAGLMSNDDDWARAVIESANRAGEPVWRLPLHEEYAQMVKGRYAQLTNMTERREASSIAGAEFLHHFAGDRPWAHLDIAGTAYDVRKPYFDRGATGFGVRLLIDLARSFAAARFRSGSD